MQHVQVSQVVMTHLCEETPVTVVNGQLPGPAIEVTEGDSVAVHVINKSPYNMTIHWYVCIYCTALHCSSM
jgi:laccase